MNNQSFVGNLTRDPVLKTGAEGKNRVLFTVAVNEGERGTPSEKSHFLDFTAFGTLADNIAASLKSGMRVVVTARVDTYKREVTITDAQTGQPKLINKTEVSFIANAVGPDLRWATSAVTKTQSSNTGGAYQAPQGQAAPAQQVQQPVAAAAGGYAPQAAASDDF